MKSGRKYGQSPTGIKWSEDPKAYAAAYRRLDDQVALSRQRARERRQRTSNDPKVLAENAAYLEKWRKENPDYMKEWRARNRDRLAARQRERTLRAYGLTVADFERMEQEQGGVCAICGSPPGGRWGRLFVDHCHQTGAVRGLLCHLCNTALERVDNYRVEIDRYLEKSKCDSI